MSTTRVEAYLHSDSVSANKGGALIRVATQTDFASRTPAFQDFAKRCARLCYAAQAQTWDDVITLFPDIEEERLALQASLRETVQVDHITVVPATA